MLEKGFASKLLIFLVQFFAIVCPNKWIILRYFLSIKRKETIKLSLFFYCPTIWHPSPHSGTYFGTFGTWNYFPYRNFIYKIKISGPASKIITFFSATPRLEKCYRIKNDIAAISAQEFNKQKQQVFFLLRKLQLFSSS